MTEIRRQQQVPAELGGSRLDQVAAELFADFSRSRLQSWIKSGEMTVDGQVSKPKHRLLGGEWLAIDAELEATDEWLAQEIPLDIVFEDEHLLVINKPAGLVVHPAAGHTAGTLLNAILNHYPTAAELPRVGIVHRLDKDTSGIMVVAKSLLAQTHLVQQLQSRSMGREYEAVVVGQATAGGTVDEPIGRHPRQRQKMAVTAQGKEAVTHFRILQRFGHHMHLRLKLETGRTHQIRVHMAHRHLPLVGDRLYNPRQKMPRNASAALIEALRSFPRQALHACQLQLIHPLQNELMQWQVPLAQDIQELLAVLKREDALHAQEST